MLLKICDSQNVSKLTMDIEQEEKIKFFEILARDFGKKAFMKIHFMYEKEVLTVGTIFYRC